MRCIVLLDKQVIDARMTQLLYRHCLSTCMFLVQLPMSTTIQRVLCNISNGCDNTDVLIKGVWIQLSMGMSGQCPMGGPRLNCLLSAFKEIPSYA